MLQEKEKIEIQELLRNLAKIDNDAHYKAICDLIKTGFCIDDACLFLKEDENSIDYDLFVNAILDRSQPFADRYALFRYLGVRAFSENDYRLDIIKDTYLALLAEIKDQVTPKFSRVISDTKKVFLFCDQFLLHEKHAPSNIIHQWAEGFKAIGLSVHILATPFNPYPFPLKSYIKNNRLLVGKNTQYTIDQDIILHELSGAPSKIFFDMIYSIGCSEKDIYMLFGNLNFYFDLLPFHKKFVFPMASPKNSVTSALYMVYYDKKYSTVANINNDSMGFIQSPLNYDKTVSNVVFNPPIVDTKKSINLVIVGNRLDDEITEDFWQDLLFLLQSCPLLRIYLVGRFDKPIPESLQDKVVYSGYQRDLYDFYKDMHLYINPPRIGGGTSAIMAIKAGIPVLTLNYGDTFMAIKEGYSIQNFTDDILSFIQRYSEDQAFKCSIDEINLRICKSYYSEGGLSDAIQHVSAVE